MYIIEWNLLHKEIIEVFQSADVSEFFERIEELRDLGHSLFTYFID